jgi:hypothetical protein
MLSLKGIIMSITLLLCTNRMFFLKIFLPLFESSFAKGENLKWKFPQNIACDES